MTSGAERQAAYRARRREQGKPAHPERIRQGAARSQAEKNNRAAHRSGGAPRPRPWLFVDTEGANDPDGLYGDPGRQYTFCITAADDLGHSYSLHRDRPLTTREMLKFLVWEIPYREFRYRFGGYFFGYDRDQILCDVPEDDLRTLFGTPSVAGEIIVFDRFWLKMFATKLTVGIVPKGGLQIDPQSGRPKGASREVWDVGKFYGAKFSTVIENWGVATPAEQTFIERMKDERANFDIAYWRQTGVADRIIAYSLLENRLAARLQTKFDDTCADLGYPLTQWYGAGSMAKAMLATHGVKDHLDNRAPLRRYKVPAADLASALPSAYFGGRFEILRPGVFSPIHEYDLRSAYPASYRSLPCLTHGGWTYVNKTADRRIIRLHDLYLVDWQIRDRDCYGPFPQRDRAQKICYPRAGTGALVYGEELAAALQMWPQTEHGMGIQIQRRWAYRSHCVCRPFDWIDRVYAARRELGKDTRGYPLKLGMNAAYGSLASTLGAEWDGTRVTRGWWSPQWAAMITGWTRARLLDAMYASGGPGDHIIMHATDAIYSTRPIDLDLTDRLGGWEAHTYQAGLLIQPGVYHLQGQDIQVKLKGRGINFRDIQDRIQDFYDAHLALGDGAEVQIPISPRYQGLKACLHMNRLDNAWRWRSGQTRRVSFDPSGKRELRPSGKWMPRPAVADPQPHGGFKAVMDGVTYKPTESDIEMLIAGANLLDQPDGGMAL
jgi:hypothetical protein